MNKLDPSAVWPFPSKQLPDDKFIEHTTIDSPVAGTHRRYTPPAPGQLWPSQGGIYAGIITGDDGKAYHLVFAEAGSAGDFAQCTWGERGIDVAGAKSHRDGMPNTIAMAEAGCSLALQARALTLGEYTDWYIPARHELRLAYVNAASCFGTDDYYWSSTQYSAINAWSQYFAGGYQYPWLKDNEFRARAVRRFSVIE